MFWFVAFMALSTEVRTTTGVAFGGFVREPQRLWVEGS